MDWTPDDIRALRKAERMSQAQLADQLGLGSKSRVSEMERGHTKPSESTKRLLDRIRLHGVVPEHFSSASD